jgi:hypothetical protein
VLAVRSGFAVAILPVGPRLADEVREGLGRGAAAQRAAQVEAVAREQAGEEAAVGGEPPAAALTAEGAALRGDDADLAKPSTGMSSPSPGWSPGHAAASAGGRGSARRRAVRSRVRR